MDDGRVEPRPPGHSHLANWHFNEEETWRLFIPQNGFNRIGKAGTVRLAGSKGVPLSVGVSTELANGIRALVFVLEHIGITLFDNRWS